MNDDRRYFHELADVLTGLLRPGEVFTAWLEGEHSDFARFNRNRLRQAGEVRQRVLSLDWIEGRRHATAKTDLSGNIDADRALLGEIVAGLRAQRQHLPEDPHLLYATELHNTDTSRGGESALPSREEAMREITDAAAGLDLTGLWAAGTLYRAFANSFGQRNWYEARNFSFDWSVYLRDDKAIKGAYAGFDWNAAKLRGKIAETRDSLAALARDPVTIPPGDYRVYLWPAALQELFTLLAWGGFGLKSHRTRQTALIAMIEEGRRLHDDVTLRENHAGGGAPPFTPSGHLKPKSVTLVESGEYRDCLADPRSAQEFGVPVNAASEFPQSLDLAPGHLSAPEALAQLDRGLAVQNLWYANYSGRASCRLTGMTRFGTFWVENGTIAAPVNVMRFDDSLYRMLGENLIGLTREREFLFETSTYFSRSTASWCLPGALIGEMRFTL